MRLEADDYFITIARMVSLRGTCVRRKVGCVLVDAKRHILATGYNGVARGLPHCGESGSSCKGARFSSGEGLAVCEAIHAEQNAVLQCTRPDEVMDVYVTVMPCVNCAKLLLNTSMQRLVAWAPYAHDEETMALLGRAGIIVRVYQEHQRVNLKSTLMKMMYGA